ncbi:FtsX-like permease family protein [Thermicanus aegyptius]|uniref:FtsX-like permease family protein n=1 Tax=Thermicanus aegyptius TaxID=94009 RepID=UPI00042501BE|nr:FtsX-like permease family protein [Thermicanus aegyptius]
MKKNRLLLMFFSLLISLALYILLSLVASSYQVSNFHTYEGTKDETIVSIRKRMAPDVEEIEAIRKEFLELVKSSPQLTIVMDPDWDLTLYVHDPFGSFRDDSLVKGEYFKADDFFSDENPVMVEQDSAAFLLVRDDVAYINGYPRPLRAIYSEGYPLFANKYQQYDHISTLGSATDWQGTYYFRHADQKTLTRFISIFQKYGYQMDPMKMTSNIKDWFMFFFRDPKRLVIGLGILFIYLSYFVTYDLLFSRREREFMIHRHYGATKNQLMMRIMGSIIPFIGFGAFLGSMVGIGLMLVIGERPEAFVFAGSFILHILMSGLFIAMAYYRRTLWNQQRGVTL